MPGVYPTSPPIERIDSETLDWDAVEQEFDGVYRHVRRRHLHSVRKPQQVVYTGLTRAELDLLLNFWVARRGFADRFTFTHPREGTVFQARIVGPFRARMVGTAGRRYDVIVTIEEAP